MKEVNPTSPKTGDEWPAAVLWLMGGCGSAANNKDSTKQTKEKTTEQKKKKKRKER